MAADKRNFDDFEKFPGRISEGTGYHEFPLLTYKDGANRERIWQIFIRLIKSSEPRINKIDWNVLTEKQIPIKKIYYGYNQSYHDLPKGSIVEVWSETGIKTGKITRNTPTYFEKPVLVGQINQRNPLHQALIYARSLYLKKKAKSSKKCKSQVTNVMYFPMLAITEDKGLKFLHFPLIVQPKLDGTRTLVFLKKPNTNYKNVIVYTRTKKEYPNMQYLQIVLYPYLNDLYDHELNQSLYLDGELYKHGRALQDISGSVRNSKKSKVLSELNEYHIYDCFYPLELNTAYESRREQLQVLFDELTNKKIKELGFAATDIIKPVPDWKVKTLKEAKSRFKKLIAKKYEGIIMRNLDGEYLADANRTGSFMRSKDLVKMKQRFTDEFEVVGFTEGKRGKDKGAIIWIIQTGDGQTMHVTPKDITYEERRALFLDAKKHFKKKYLSRMLTVEYEDLSKTNKPLRAKALAFRDYE